ncbi:amidohydrolase family protein [Asticcacaulis tiandongensis]|uniref:amidohydrolase family protein n=1 Tax=Asticcacaulis tiandongensis TaxID=2565365 RepID=UPI0015E86EA8|nr:amidohydrolase family protein [Asticcacaulis tiandongensis]
MTTPIIDLHSHWFSPSSVAHLSDRTYGPRITTDTSGVKALHRPAAGETPLPFVLGNQWFDIEARLAHLDANHVKHQLLSWPTTLGVDPALSADDTRLIWRDYNDELAALVRQHPRHLSAVAALSTSDISWSVTELKRSHEELGLIGAVLPVNGFASLAAARHFAPLFAEAQKHKSHIYLHTGYAHPQISGQPPVWLHADNPQVRGTLDTAWQFASSVITLAYTGFLDDYPDVTVQVAMLGGSGVIALVAEAAKAWALRHGSVPKDRFERLWLDTGAAGQGPAAIAAAVRVLGADRILFGSDYAPAPDIAPVIANVQAAGLSETDAQKIFYSNGHALLARHGIQLD